jgi:DNA polymerase-3 subunit alpha
MGKKKPEVMNEERKQFIQGAMKLGRDKKKAAEIFDLLIPFAGYGFSKLHSAPYSLLAYRTAYLKSRYPAEFMAANLTSEINDTKKLAQYMSEARGMGIAILPPDVNLSDKEFAVREGKIVYGLCGVKNVGAGAVDAILTEREKNGPYSAIQDFMDRVDHKDVNRKVMEALILAGVLDRFSENRATLFHSLDRLLETAARHKERTAFGQTALFDDKQMEELETFELEKIDEWPRTELLRLERENLGFFFSGHPLEEFSSQIENHVDLDLSTPERLQPGRTYTTIGILKEIKEIITRNGKKMAFGVLEDYSNSIEIVIFPGVYEKGQELLTEGSAIAVRGKIDNARGDTKLLADEIITPDGLPEKRSRALHIRLAGDCLDENSFCELRDFLMERSGECPVYFHMNGGGEETVVRASSSIRVQEDSDIITRLESQTVIEQVWRE